MTFVPKFPYGAKVFNVRNPKLAHSVFAHWETLLPAVVEAGEPHLQVVKPDIWLARLQSSKDAGLDGDDAVNNPAVKLIDLFTWLWTPGTGQAAGPMDVLEAWRASPSLQNVERVKLGWMRKWMGEWTAQRTTREPHKDKGKGKEREEGNDDTGHGSGLLAMGVIPSGTFTSP